MKYVKSILHESIKKSTQVKRILRDHLEMLRKHEDIRALVIGRSPLMENCHQDDPTTSAALKL